MSHAHQDLADVLVIIPVLNEAATIAQVVHTLREHYGFPTVCVVDNGSTDDSAALAAAAGAWVIHEPRPGYGQACWRGLQELEQFPKVEWVFFCDGDGSDDLSELSEFLQRRSEFDLIVGDRTMTLAGRSVMTGPQLLGNALATTLIRWGWGFQYHDLGPLRLIRRSALEAIAMRDRGFGWTLEMQVRAIECGLRICEVPVNYRPRQGGKSKISGTLQGSFKAGTTILSTLGHLYWRSAASPLLMLSTLLLVVGSALAMPYGDFLQTG
ncbi:MAG: glycosyltransferase family 2 protein, partial [Cyanobacteria bacterium P01_H01_bin.121]